MTTNAQYLQKKLAVLIGATVVGFDVFDMEDEQDGFGVLLQLKDGRTALVDVWRDPEGNGPGWLNLNPIPRE